MFMLPKRLFALTLLASAFAVMPQCVLRAQWVQTNGPIDHKGYPNVDGAVYANGSTVFVSTEVGIIYSSDSGKDWIIDTIGIGAMQVDGFLQDDTNFFAGTCPGLYRSSENNPIWTLVDDSLKDLCIDLLFSQDSQLYASASLGAKSLLTTSRDHGNTWTIDTSASDRYLPLYATNDSTFFESRDGELFRSTDSGKSWTELNNILSSGGPIAVSGSTIYVSGDYRIAESTDNGDHWTIDTLGLGIDTTDLNTLYESQAPPLIVSGNNILTVYRKAVSAFSGENEVFKTTNGQGSWNSVGYFPDGGLNLSASGNIIVAGSYSSGSGVSISTDNGTTWNTCGPIVSFYCSINSVAAIGSNIVAGNGAALFLSTDGGDTWKWIDSSLDYVECLSVINGNIIAGTESGIVISSDEGITWRPSISSCSMTNIDWLANNGSNVFAGNYSSIIHSTDGGITWAIPDSSTFINLYGSAVSEQSVFAWGYNPPGWLVRSTDEGNSWFPDTVGLNGSGISELVVCNGVILAVGNGLFSSTDDGATWKLTVKDFNTNCFAVQDSYIFSGVAYGVSVSTNRGLDWSLSLNEQNPDVTALCIDGPDIIAGVGGCCSGPFSGVWRCPLSALIPTPSAVAETPPASNNIHSYPNPFSQSTQISFTSPDAGYAEISIVNLLGEQVARVFSGELDAGSHNFTFANTTGLPDGIYECMIRMNGRVGTLPLVLIH
jgi:photosystem II stability/assembly factor-like uncharacterized protein